MFLSPASGRMSQPHEPSPQQGIVCDYITEPPEDYETNRLAEPFASPYDPAVPRATRSSATRILPVPPVQRPNPSRLRSEAKSLKFRQSYLAKQFGAYRPAVEQVGLIGVPSGFSSTGPGGQDAYSHHQHSPAYPSTSPRWYPPTTTCDRHPPYGTRLNSQDSDIPTTKQLLEGMYVPTWDQLDVASRQIKELYALRALLDPQGHRLRTHVAVLPNVPSEEHRIWGGLVPLASGNSQVGGVVNDGWDVFGDLDRDCSSTRARAPESPVSTLWLGESRISTPITVLDEPLVGSSVDHQAFESDDESAHQSDSDEALFSDVIEAWNKLDDMMIQVRVRSDMFVYPAKLDFVPAYGADNEPIVNRRSLRNKAFVQYWEFLYRSLDELNGIDALSERMVIALQHALEDVNSELEKMEGRVAVSGDGTKEVLAQCVCERLNRPEQPAPALRTKARTAGPTPVTPEENHLYYYFCIDDRLLYLSFFEDWGPLNLAQVYRACILIHELLQDANLKRHRIVLYSTSDPRRRANSALLMALYCMIVQRRTPWEVFYPIAEVEFMPFRDAGRGRSDFHLGIQDCLWGVWKAQHNHLLDMNEFSVDEYEYYEKVDNGDWNWITPGFIAFASPVDSVWIRQQKEGKNKPSGATTSALQRKLPTPFMNVLEYFSERNVKLVVRLNNELYDKDVFEERGIEHLDLYFDDGTNPADDITRTFIAKSDAIIEAGGAVAVHCKAGLGRTGTLIGAYLIYKYGFTASEAIGFMRIVRPGSVVGPQQQFMYMKQLEWAKWAAIDEIRRAEAQRTEVPTPRTPPEEIQPMTTGSTNGNSASPVRSGQSAAPSSPRAITPPGLMSSPVISTGTVPITPHKARPTTPIKTDAPVLQPRKTPAAKRAAGGDEEVEDEGDQLGVLGVGFRRVSGKRVAGGDAGSASRSEGGSRTKRDGAIGGGSKSDSGGTRLPAGAMSVDRGKSTGVGIGRATRSSTRIVAKRAAEIEASLAAPSPPVTSKPRLISHATMPNGKPEGTNDKEQEDEDPDWTHGEGANAVVMPGSKLERPNLRSVRRRRSSFSAADIVT
ncbi:tyrosine-phosphatase [Rhizoctonia solani 123E]|uniref:protein-tyrosine-phosphatase n=1 Tax=Rhizoctonia solani 123E TaxID=1423351 RepID=A0A074SUX8_9AGAM|nr:tyrosine-phosphatase [Rhizoctonia solani 123E]